MQCSVPANVLSAFFRKTVISFWSVTNIPSSLTCQVYLTRESFTRAPPALSHQSTWMLSTCWMAPLMMRSNRISASAPSTSSFITTAPVCKYSALHSDQQRHHLVPRPTPGGHHGVDELGDPDHLHRAAPSLVLFHFGGNCNKTYTYLAFFMTRCKICVTVQSI